MPRLKVKKPVRLEADYFVTGVWIDEQKSVTHLLLHEVQEQTRWSTGRKTAAEKVIALVNEGKHVRAMRWSYVSARWVSGVLLKTTVDANSSHSIKAATNNIITDNLEHLVHMHYII